MTHSTKVLIVLFQAVLMFSAAGLAISIVMLQKKRTPPWSGKLPARYFKIVQRWQFTLFILFAAGSVCQLMVSDDPADRIFTGSLTLFFLALAWMSTRLVLISRRLRT